MNDIIQECLRGAILWVAVYIFARTIFRAYFTERKVYMDSVVDKLKEQSNYYEKEPR